MSFALTKEKFAVRFHEIGGFKDMTASPEGRGFKLKLHELNPNAPLSPFYIDVRVVQSDFKAKRQAVRLFQEMMTALKDPPELLAGIPEAIVPIVSSLSDQANIPMITPRSGKTHGSGGKVDGIWTPGQRTVVFDDVMTRADSKIEAVRTLRYAGLQVENVMILVDRQQGGGEQLKANGLMLQRAFTLDELLEFYRNAQLMTPQVYDQIVTYRGQQK